MRLRTVIAVALAGCGDESPLAEVAPAPEPPPGVVLEGRIVLAKAIHAPGAAPARFSADLPRSWDEVIGGGGPPLGHANDAWCAGDARIRSQWAERVAHDAAAGADGWTLYTTWGSIASCGGDDAVCADLRAPFSAETGAVQETYGYLLSQCDGAETAAAIEAGPFGPVVQWYRTRGWNGGPWSPRLESALRDAISTGDAAFVRDVAGTLGNLDPARGEALVLELRSRARGGVRDALTASLWRSKSPEGVAAMTELCGRAAVEVDPTTQQPLWPECGWRASSASYTAVSRSDLTEWVRQWGSDPAERARENPDERDAIEQALTDCVRDEVSAANASSVEVTPWTVHTCLRRLAELDRSAAAAMAPSVQSAKLLDYPAMDTLTAALIRFPREEDLVRRAREIGLSQGSAVRDERAVVTAEDVLAREGRLYRTIDQGWGWPVSYEHLLRQLARMSPELGGARFESFAPVYEAAPAPVVEEPASPLAGLFSTAAPALESPAPPAYVVHAWDDGVAWRIEARDLDEWPDLDASLGLMNRLLEARGSDLRYAETQDGNVVLAPRESLIAADEDGLLALADPAKRWADEQAAATAETFGGD